MALNSLQTRLKKFLKYLGLGSLTALLTVVLGLGAYPTGTGIARLAPEQFSTTVVVNEGGRGRGREGASESPFGIGGQGAILTGGLFPTHWSSVNAAVPDSSGVPSSIHQASPLVQEGLQRYQSGQFAGAATLWQQAADAFATQGDRLNQAMVLSNLALAYHQLGRWTEANEAIATSLQLLQSENLEFDHLKILAQALNTQGRLQFVQGQTEQALTTLQKATETYQQVGNKTGVVRSLINQAQALKVLGFYQRANATLKQVSQILQDQPDSAIKASGLLSYGEVLRLLGDLKTSEEVLKKSLTISQQLQSPPAITAALLSLGNTAHAQQQFEQALQFYQQAIATSTSPTTTLQAQLNQLRLFVETKKWLDAQTLAAKIQPQLATLPVSRTAIYAQISFTQSMMKVVGCSGGEGCRLEPSTLANLLAIAQKQAQELGDQRAESYALGYLGQLYEQTQQGFEAQTITQKALLLAQASNAPDSAYLWQWQLGRLLKAQAHKEKTNSLAYNSAIAAYQEAIKTLNSLRSDLVATNLDLQFSFREGVEPVYRQLVSLLLQPPPGQGEVSQENLQQARQVIESLRLAELDNFFREACLTATARPKQIDRIDPQAAVIYPIILPDRLEVIVSQVNKPLRHYTTVINQSDLEKTLEGMRRAMRRTSLDKDRLPLSRKIYDWLVRPAESELVANGITTLVFALDSSLRNLPMAALYDGQQYLVQKYNIALTPSLQLLEPRPLTRQPITVLVAGLSESRHNFSALPGVKSEVQQIKSNIPVQVLLNQEFTSTAIQNQIEGTSFPVVHLATHGQFSSNAEDTFILAWDEPINVKQLGGLLQSREQSDRTAIELLVLSACQTAAGDNRATLGLAGVAVRSGARSTLATLWPVDDQSTSSFMVEFYQTLAQSQMSKAEVLRRSQLALLKQARFKHPYYWAPFVLVGNWL